MAFNCIMVPIIFLRISLSQSVMHPNLSVSTILSAYFFCSEFIVLKQSYDIYFTYDLEGSMVNSTAKKRLQLQIMCNALQQRAVSLCIKQRTLFINVPLAGITSLQLSLLCRRHTALYFFLTRLNLFSKIADYFKGIKCQVIFFC